MCDVAPAASEETARALIEQVRAGSRDAGHHCTAYLLGPDAGTVRSNDDGEPSGTAGAPMLAALQGTRHHGRRCRREPVVPAARCWARAD